MDETATSTNIRYMHPKKLEGKTHVAAFLQFGLPSYSEEAVDNILNSIRVGLKKNEVGEQIICFTDARSIPDEIVRKLLEIKLLSIIHCDDPKNVCLSDHFWRFSTFNNESVKFISSSRVCPGGDSDNNLQHQGKVLHFASNADTQNHLNEGNDCLVFHNYHKMTPERIVNFIQKLLPTTQIKKLVDTGKQHFFVSLRTTDECSQIKERLQNRVLHIYSAVRQETDNDIYMDTDQEDNDQELMDTNTLNQEGHEENSLNNASNFSDGLPDQDPSITNPDFFGVEQKELIVFWDIQNCNIKSALVTEYVKYIKAKFGTANNTLEAFVGAYDVCSDTGDFLQALCDLGVTVIHGPTDKKQVADVILTKLIDTFSKNRQSKATVVVITGDKDFASALIKVKKEQNVVHLIHKKECSKRLTRGIENRYVHEDIIEEIANRMEVSEMPTSTVAQELISTEIDELRQFGEVICEPPYYTLICKDKVYADRALNKLRNKYHCKVMKIVTLKDSYHKEPKN